MFSTCSSFKRTKYTNNVLLRFEGTTIPIKVAQTCPFVAAVESEDLGALYLGVLIIVTRRISLLKTLSKNAQAAVVKAFQNPTLRRYKILIVSNCME